MIKRIKTLTQRARIQIIGLLENLRKTQLVDDWVAIPSQSMR
jgi:hypothetical protein